MVYKIHNSSKQKIFKIEKSPAPNTYMQDIDPSKLVFALDIGTRTIIGIVGIQEGDKFNIIAAEIEEHKTRSMLDGQIHHIEEVAAVARSVKKALESRLGIELTNVSIAAAGRTLKTCQVKIEHEINFSKPITKEMIKALELDGMQKAQTELNNQMNITEHPPTDGGSKSADTEENEEQTADTAKQELKSPYYCVGYDVCNYYLNNYMIASLEGHKGNIISADILATFLPYTVVDGLYTVMERIGLSVCSLTLEPIAAINAVIPKDLRLLNLALVDIGAGTSDIAITRGGSVIAYAMVPVAGDEVTEALCQHYLLDFATAERVKVDLSSKAEKIEFDDIIGNRQIKTADEIKEVIFPVVKNLAETISQEIINYNGKAPNAVFLVGGASQVSGLTKQVAETLGISSDRVAVRRSDSIPHIKNLNKKFYGPDTVTALGIAITSNWRKWQSFLTVTVNDKSVKLFNSKKLMVSDALNMSGINPGQLIGKTGRALTFKLNGETRTIKGGYGESAQIYLNDKLSGLDAAINQNDRISIVPATDGETAKITVAEIKEYYEGTACDITINGKPATDDQQHIHSGDIVEVEYDSEHDNVEDIEQQEVENTEYFISNKTFKIKVNGEDVEINDKKDSYIFVDIFNYIDFDYTNPQGNIVLKLNGLKAGFADTIKTGDSLEIRWE